MANPDDGADSANAFKLLGDATRLAIVTELYDPDLVSPVAFSDLYDRIDIDDTAQFNYHLDRLVPHFVVRSDDGYALTERGKRVARVVGAETYAGGVDRGPFPVEGACYDCGESELRATYEDERLTVECQSCDAVVPPIPVPPSVVEGHDTTAVGAAVDRWATAQVDLALDGVCPTCGAAVDPSIAVDAEYTLSFDAVGVFACEVCGRRTTVTVGGVATRHDAVREFHRRRGRPLADRRFWEVGQYAAGEGVTVVDRDPPLVRVTFHADGDACHAEVDDDLTVVRTEVVADDASDA